jgi:hypothetical protein
MTLQEVKTEALRYGYILRRVGHKRMKVQAYRPDGTPARNCYIPHIPCDARTFAHTHRTLGRFRDLVKRQGHAVESYSDLWNWVLAVVDAHIVREITERVQK